MALDDDRSFSEFYNARRGPLLRFLMSRLRNQDEAEEVLQDAFVKFRQAQRDQDVANPEALLIKIAANLSIDRMRETKSRRAREKAWSDIYLSDDFGASASSSDAVQHRATEARAELDRVIQLLSSLSRPVRTAFILHRFKGLTHKEISEQMGLSRSTIEKHIMKAAERIMDEMG